MRSSDDLAHIRAVFLSGKVGYKRNFTGALQGTLMPHTKRRDLTGQKRSTQYKSSQRHFKDIHQAETIANWQLLKMLVHIFPMNNMLQDRAQQAMRLNCDLKLKSQKKQFAIIANPLQIPTHQEMRLHNEWLSTH